MSLRIAIVNSIDGVSNEKKAQKTYEILSSFGYECQIIDVSTINIHFSVFYAHSLKEFLSIFYSYVLFLIERFQYFFHIKEDYPFIEKANLQALELFYFYKINTYDVLICQIADVAPVLTYDFSGLKICDLPTPWVEELKFSNQYSKFYISKLKKWENHFLDSSDHITYGWYSYVEYAKKYLYKGKKYFISNWGCDANEASASYMKSPRIVFVGYLSGYWANLPLLSFLTKICPYQIDVYGTPEPPKNLGLHYKGYLKDTSVLKNYQFGLLTISKDRLRKKGWSFKQMDYISYGLPILMPSWRRDPVFKDVCIYFSKKNFLKKINEYTDEYKWTAVSRKAKKLSADYQWKTTMKPLVEIIKNYAFLKKF